jgi:hypothetical protein
MCGGVPLPAVLQKTKERRSDINANGLRLHAL